MPEFIMLEGSAVIAAPFEDAADSLVAKVNLAVAEGAARDSGVKGTTLAADYRDEAERRGIPSSRFKDFGISSAAISNRKKVLAHLVDLGVVKNGRVVKSQWAKQITWNDWTDAIVAAGVQSGRSTSKPKTKWQKACKDVDALTEAQQRKMLERLQKRFAV